MKKSVFLLLAVLLLFVGCDDESYRVGDTGPAGGIVFYDKGEYSDGWRYLEAAPEDITVGSTSTFAFGYYRPTSDGSNLFVNGTTTYEEGTSDASDGKCTGTAIGTGKANTAKLVIKMGSTAYEGSSGTDTTASYAAKMCGDYTVENGGVTYGDWFLPGKDELNLIYTNLKSKDLGGFSSDYYWSSSEGSSARHAWVQYFDNGDQYDGYRFNDLRVRAVRAF